MADSAVRSQGTYLNIGSGITDDALTDTYVKFCVASVNKSGSSTAQIDVTTLCSQGVETISGVTDYGTVTASYNYRPGEEVQKLLQAHEDSKRKFNAKIVYPDDGLGNGAVEVSFKATIESMSENASANDAIRGSITLKISGQPTVKLPVATPPPSEG